MSERVRRGRRKRWKEERGGGRKGRVSYRGGGHPGISPPPPTKSPPPPPPTPEKIDGNIISIMNVDVHYRNIKHA